MQKLVQRALRWILHLNERCYLKVDALCEATSIEAADSKRNVEAIPEETEILRWCSSLVRESVDGNRLELAHFTVKEYLMQIDPTEKNEFSSYGMEGSAHLEIAERCLTYLNFEDFNQEGKLDKDTAKSRIERYPLRAYAIEQWRFHAMNHFSDPRILPLLKKLFHPTKPNNLISIFSDRLWLDRFVDGLDDRHHDLITSGFAEANALHFAAMAGVPELCSWLIENGCDINRNTRLGTPLTCTVLRYTNLLLVDITEYMDWRVDNSTDAAREDIVSMLLAAQANPNICDNRSPGITSPPVWVAISEVHLSMTLQLLKAGSRLDSACLDLLDDVIDWVQRQGKGGKEEVEGDEEDEDSCTWFIRAVLEHISDRNVEEKNREKVSRLAYRARRSGRLDTSGKGSSHSEAKGLSQEASLRIASEYGRIEVIDMLLEDRNLDVNCAQDVTGLTALHLAAANNHLQIVKKLQLLGADLHRPDSNGRTAVHHSILGNGSDCLSFLLQQKIRLSHTDTDELNLWNLASRKRGAQFIDELLIHCVNGLDRDSRGPNGRTAVMYAAKNGNADCMKSLMIHGCDLTAIDDDGWNPAHYACFFNHKNILECMRDTRVDWNGRARAWIDGRKLEDVTPLHLAASIRDDQNLRYIVCENLVSDINISTRESMTALYIAAWSNSPRSVSFLLSRGAEAKIMPNIGESPLHLAARFGLNEIIQKLLEHDCDIELRDGDGLNAELLALKHGYDEVVKILQEHTYKQGMYHALHTFQLSADVSLRQVPRQKELPSVRSGNK